MILEDASDLDPFVEIELQTPRDDEESGLQQRHDERRWLAKVRRLLRRLLGSLGALWRRLRPSAVPVPLCVVPEHAQVDVIAWSSHLERAGSKGAVTMDLFASPSRDLVRALRGTAFRRDGCSCRAKWDG
ncbi:hypothetical protein V5799_002558 [Amblyomma americanum]|uniref:Uncharacterized protein n=1 Tax=Amblyomma americanum TaxID=6943 RepID=A0AAQ4CWZ6_AMBAM